MTKIRDGADMIQDQEYLRIAGQLELALKEYKGTRRDGLITQVAQLQAAIKSYGLASTKVDEPLAHVKETLDIIEIEHDLALSASEVLSWSEEERTAHVRAMMESL